MIRGITGQGSLVVSGGNPGSTYYQTGQTMSGQVRYHNNNLEVYDGSSWHIIQGSYATVALSAEAEIAVKWATDKIREEQTLKGLIQNNPAIRAAYESVLRAEEQLQTTIILSKDEQTAS